jgi:putative transposase
LFATTTKKGGTPMESRVVINSLPQAFQVIKEMNLATEGWESDYRVAGRDALRVIVEQQMRDRVSWYLDEMARLGEVDRRNGSFPRHLVTELGDIELHIPRTRRFSPLAVVQAYARRARSVDQAIMACFVLGLSTRKVASALLPILGEPVSATTVSRIAQSLDKAVEAFHRRPITRRYRFLFLDGVVLKRKTGAGAVKRVVLVALGITPEGKKEVIDFFTAFGESQNAWETFLADLYRRGLDAEGGSDQKVTFGLAREGMEMIIVDGGKGLMSALPLVYPRMPVQRCWAHKVRNVLNYVRKGDYEAVKRALAAISHAPDIRQAQGGLRRFTECWGSTYPKAVACLLKDEENLLTFFQINDPSLWSQIRTTNAIERRFREVRRRTRPMGVFSDRASMERILYAVFSYENLQQGTGTPFLLLTQTC